MARPFSEAGALALAYLAIHPDISPLALAQQTGCSLRTAQRLIAAHREAAGLPNLPIGRPPRRQKP